MPIDTLFVDDLITSMSEQGWHFIGENLDYSNPIELVFEERASDQILKILLHARTATPQSGENTSHGRPAGEFHAQMIFDGDRRGRGERNHLRFSEAYLTALIGFTWLEGECVVAAYDPEKHMEYAYSKSLQVKERTLRRALHQGISFQKRPRNDETVVCFRLDQSAQYFLSMRRLHDFEPESYSSNDDPPLEVIEAIETDEAFDPPLLLPQERKRRTAEISRYVRSRTFARGIFEVYERCATCGFQYDKVLNAAHIIPVGEGGEDTYENGIGLCPRCHYMYDRGQILIDRNGQISINEQLAEIYRRQNSAESLKALRASLYNEIWRPHDPMHHPSSENLASVFKERSQWTS